MGGITDTYSYVGSSEVIARISPSSGASTSSIVDPTGARLAVSTSSGGFGWTLSDLHGNLAGYATATGSVISDALRYDPYGETLASVSSGLAAPFRYQGRLLLSATGDADLYDFVFRAYAPDLGSFSSPDDLAGSALNPITFNRYLYAGGDPATMVDPDGHAFFNRNLYDGGAPGKTKAGTSGLSPARQAAAKKAEQRVTSRAPRTKPAKGATAARINRALAADQAMSGERWSGPPIATRSGQSCISAKGCLGATNRGGGGTDIHALLDVAGFVPVVGTGADLANAALYGLQGDWGLAGLSAFAAIPLLGDAAAAGKLVTKYGDDVVRLGGDARGIIYRTGSQTDNALTDPLGVSFRDSISSSTSPIHPQVFKPGDKIFAIDTGQLPAGSVRWDGVPVGHVTVTATPDAIRSAVVEDPLLAYLKRLEDGSYRLPK